MNSTAHLSPQSLFGMAIPVPSIKTGYWIHCMQTTAIINRLSKTIFFHISVFCTLYWWCQLLHHYFKINYFLLNKCFNMSLVSQYEINAIRFFSIPQNIYTIQFPHINIPNLVFILLVEGGVLKMHIDHKTYQNLLAIYSYSSISVANFRQTINVEKSCDSACYFIYTCILFWVARDDIQWVWTFYTCLPTGYQTSPHLHLSFATNNFNSFLAERLNDHLLH